MSDRTLKEWALEELIEQNLLNHGGYERGSNARWVWDLALDRETLLEFILATQPKEWERLSAIHGEEVERKFLLRLFKELDNRGMLDALRHGIVDYGVRFQLAFFAPATGLNPETRKLYEANRLTMLRQLHIGQKNEHDSVDIVLCLNGLPVITIEFKKQSTSQASDQPWRQYLQDRDPRELLFSFKKRALAHFAVDADEVWMTTALNGRETRFLPFNKGHEKGAGNPPNPDSYPTAYLWEDILTRDSLMDIIANYCHLQKAELNFNGRKVKKESLIFPRYHQLDVVRKLQATLKADGIGKNYLIQHSAGSGKSNSIAWLAHSLASLHGADDRPIFDSVIVVSDRRVLDRQLQETIYQFEHKQGVVVKIDKDSEQLARALVAGVKIIVTTLQKFPFVIDKIGDMPARKYAVIVDEAHSSQTGDASDAMKKVLASVNDVNGVLADDLQRAEDADDWNYEDELVRTMEARRARQANMSFFAFTATPKPKTLIAFGELCPDGKPEAWHLYSMRQAVEEGFILDVLKNYTTYKTFFKLTKQIAEDPNLDKRQANRAIARFLKLHPVNVSQKVEVIVEHFKRVAMQKIGGRAKAMVVTGSRLEAVRYKQEVDHYLKEKQYTNIKALVAFSGTVKDPDTDIEFTEPKMNEFGERELPERFELDEYRLLLVADKYQTGFDQPLLHTMYVDKKLSGVRAVQTLSRLNRTCPGKEDTFVLDFVNETHEIQEAFQPFYVGTTIEEEIDPNQLYDLKEKVSSYGIVYLEEVEDFARVFFQPDYRRNVRGHALLNGLIGRSVERFRAKLPGERDDFRSKLSQFIRLYSFLSQVMPFADPELEKFYAFSRLLVSKLREDHSASRFQFTDEIALEYYRLQKMSEGSISLAKDGEGGLRVAADVGTGRSEQDKIALSRLIDILNEHFGTDFTAADQLFFDQIEEDLVSDSVLAQQGKSNSIDNFKYPFNDVFINKVIDRMEQNQEIADKLMNEDRFAEVVSDLLLHKVYQRLKES
jgi:type I restriction enzyme, R subunit